MRYTSVACLPLLSNLTFLTIFDFETFSRKCPHLLVVIQSRLNIAFHVASSRISSSRSFFKESRAAEIYHSLIRRR